MTRWLWLLVVMGCAEKLQAPSVVPSCYADQLNGISVTAQLYQSKGAPMTNENLMMDALSTPLTYRCWLIVNRGWNPTSGFGGEGASANGTMIYYGGYMATPLSPEDRRRYFDNYCAYHKQRWVQYAEKPEPKGLRTWLVRVRLARIMTEEPYTCP